MPFHARVEDDCADRHGHETGGEHPGQRFGRVEVTVCRMTAIRIKISMNAATCSKIRMLVHRLSVKAPRPAMPNAKIAPITRAVSSVSVHGQIAIAADGSKNRNKLVAIAAMPSTPMSRAVLCESRRSSAVVADCSRRFRNHIAKTRKGVVKYRAAHNQNATLV